MRSFLPELKRRSLRVKHGVLECFVLLPQVALRSGFPFLRGPTPYWGTVLDIIFRYGRETRRRVRGRDG
jgi:hypothetical protein